MLASKDITHIDLTRKKKHISFSLTSSFQAYASQEERSQKLLCQSALVLHTAPYVNQLVAFTSTRQNTRVL